MATNTAGIEVVVDVPFVSYYPFKPLHFLLIRTCHVLIQVYAINLWRSISLSKLNKRIRSRIFYLSDFSWFSNMIIVKEKGVSNNTNLRIYFIIDRKKICKICPSLWLFLWRQLFHCRLTGSWISNTKRQPYTVHINGYSNLARVRLWPLGEDIRQTRTNTNKPPKMESNINTVKFELHTT